MSAYILFYDKTELDVVPNKYDGEFSNQKLYAKSLEENPLYKEKSNWLNEQGLTKHNFKEL
jgi:hypothetical protein